jgi:hypothetical protein
MRISTAAMVGFLVVAAPAAAQVRPTTPRNPGGTLITINPLGFAQFGPNLEVQPSLGPAASLALGVRVVSLGLIPNLMQAADDDNGEIGFTWTATAAFLFYPGQQAPRGWYVGPRLEIGKGTSSDNGGEYDDSPMVAAIDFGYRWLRPSGFNLSLGGQAGVIRSTWECSMCTYSYGPTRGTDVYPFAMLVLALGIRLGSPISQQQPTQPGRVVGDY